MYSLDFDPPVQVKLDQVGPVEISTVRLPKFKGEIDRWETCLFHGNGDNEVVAVYDNRMDAQIGHSRIVNSLAFFNNRFY